MVGLNIRVDKPERIDEVVIATAGDDFIQIFTTQSNLYHTQ
jgi:hypothetical protein